MANGLIFTSQRGIGSSDANIGFLSQFEAQMDDPQELTAWSVIVHYDATMVTGSSVTFTPGTSYGRVLVPVVISEANKVVDYVELHIDGDTVTSGTILDIDAVQIEQDRGQGHTPWAVGSYGQPYHFWNGSQQRSITIRNAIPVDFASPSQGGSYTIESWLYVSDASGTLKEDITEYVRSLTVTADRERDVSWTLECEMDFEGYRELTPLLDWLIPYQRITLPDGRTREGPLGHFVLLPSERTHTEWEGTVSIDARSGEFLLQIQGTKGFLIVKENTQFRRAIKVLLESAHIGKEGKRFRFDLPDHQGNDRAKRDLKWEKKENILLIINDLTRKAGWTPIYAEKTGVLTTVNRKKRRLRRMEPVRTFAANIPEDQELKPFVKRRGVTDSEIVGEVVITPKLRKVEDNKVVVISINPKKSERIEVVKYLDDPDHPMSPQKRKRIRERRIKMDVGSRADAEQLAEAILEDIGTKIDTVTFSAIPDPETEFLNRVIYLAIYDAHGREIAVGKYVAKTVVYGFTDEDALMRITAGFVHSTEILRDTDPIDFEAVDGKWVIA